MDAENDSKWAPYVPLMMVPDDHKCPRHIKDLKREERIDELCKDKPEDYIEMRWGYVCKRCGQFWWFCQGIYVPEKDPYSCFKRGPNSVYMHDIWNAEEQLRRLGYDPDE